MPTENDDIAAQAHKIWGIPVRIDTAGRRRWLKEVKAEAARKVAAGATIANLAREIGIDDCTLGKWVRKENPIKTGAPRFVEIKAPEVRFDTKGIWDPRDVRRPVDTQKLSQVDDFYECTLQIRDATLRFDASMPIEMLSNIIRAISSSD
ncbi:transposase [Rhodobacter sp. 24-YEA-8]|uniref:transposase n=1 Tax=Rhodobacter sp. 24-YEA-8 TaxID=1884310 RepID=UPI000B8041E2|nr:transposase [Rhodobacter sp. 24-YEA-8]